MSFGISPQCFDCLHLRGVVPGIGWSCAAFGDKPIPKDILVNAADHREPYPGDGGVRFMDKNEAVPAAEIVLADSVPVTDETDVVDGIRTGELPSPQKFGNSWYFALRITGTGAAYRKQLNEYVWRDGSLYLNDRFLRRCNGLPIVVEHPPGLMLNSEEYADRNIGSIVAAFVPEGRFLEANPKAKPDEVWGIGRILDMPAAEYMREHYDEVSTSPAVVFSDPDINDTVQMEDGKHLLIEGNPSLLDHVAICELGTWDREGPPTGVEVSNGESEMAEETKEETKEQEEDRADANASSEKLDKILAHLDSANAKMDALSQRMDAYDSARSDARKRDDDTEEKAKSEEKQASELEKLAEEEKEEAEEAREDSKRADRKRDDDDDDKRHDAARHDLQRRDDESPAAHSRRVDTFARRHRLDAIMCRDDESARDHSKRVDEMSPAEFEEMGTPKEAESSNDKRTDRRRADDDRKRDDRRARDVRKRDDDDDDDRKRDDSRVDSALKDIDTIKAAVRVLARKVEDPTDEARSAFADAQARADEVFVALGEQAPPPLRGEGLLPYRVRLLRRIQSHSEAWKDSDIAAIAKVDITAFGNAEKMIYADAERVARNPTSLAPMTLREIVRKRPGGGQESVFVGDPLACWGPFMAPARAATRISHRSQR